MNNTRTWYETRSLSGQRDESWHRLLVESSYKALDHQSICLNMKKNIHFSTCLYLCKMTKRTSPLSLGIPAYTNTDTGSLVSSCLIKIPFWVSRYGETATMLNEFWSKVHQISIHFFTYFLLTHIRHFTLQGKQMSLRVSLFHWISNWSPLNQYLRKDPEWTLPSHIFATLLTIYSLAQFIYCLMISCLHITDTGKHTLVLI